MWAQSNGNSSLTRRCTGRLFRRAINRRFHWTDEALSHLDNIYRYIAADAPIYALRMVDKITRRSQQIGAFPQSGREVLNTKSRTYGRYLKLRIASCIASSRKIRWMCWQYSTGRSYCPMISTPDHEVPYRTNAADVEGGLPISTEDDEAFR